MADGIYAKTPRDKLLELMKGAPNYEELQQMPDEDLRANYCEITAMRSSDRRTSLRRFRSYIQSES